MWSVLSTGHSLSGSNQSLMAKPAYRGKQWQTLRAMVLDRDGRLCQIRGPRCKRRASQVDHIVPLAHGGSNELSNLRAACATCNASTGSQVRKRTTHVVLVAGPPGAGKTTYVESHRALDDLVIDYDTIAQALGSNVSHGHGNHAAANAARGAVLTALRQGRVEAQRAWIISSNPNAATMFDHDELVTIDPGIEEVRRRSMQAQRPQQWLSLIDAWYAARRIRSGVSRDW